MGRDQVDDSATSGDHHDCSKFQTMHIVFSTGCSPSQNWQSYVFFYHAMRVGQPGNVTRIASGCTETQQQLYARRHEEEVVQKMSNRFHIHFTPDYSKVVKGDNFHYFNKPFGLRHWMENALGYPNRNHTMHDDDTIIALLDPDMVLTRPLINNVAGMSTYDWYVPNNSNDNHNPPRMDTRIICATHGRPIAQQYGYGDDWILSVGDRMVDVVGKGSPALNVSTDDATQVFAPGPPYLLTARDMYTVVTLWCKLAPKILPIYPHLLAEMYGYCMAIAHLQLRHQLAFQMMISEPMGEHEGWQFLEAIDSDKLCGHKNVKNLHVVIHYCQVYSVGRHFISKYHMQENFVSCEAPLLLNPSKDLALKNSQWRLSNGSMVPFNDLKQIRRASFMLCAVTEVLNEAATHFKQNHCGESGANFNATFEVVKFW